MARPKKEGLDYFPLDIDMDQDDKIALIEAKHGLIGFSIVVKLFMKIYKNGYYYEWSEKEQLLFSSRVNVDINSVKEVINDCINWGLFNEDVYKKYTILTSKGIQERYMEAVLRRKEIAFVNEFLLVNPSDHVRNSKIKIKIVDSNRNMINVDINPNNADGNSQSKSKSKSKSESKEDIDNNSAAASTDSNESENVDVVDYDDLPEEPNEPDSPEEFSNWFDTFYICFGRHPTPLQRDELTSFIDQDMLDPKLLCLAFEKAGGTGASYAYSRTILNDWARKGIRTYEDAVEERQRFEQQKQQRGNARPSKQNQRVEALPKHMQENPKDSTPASKEKLKWLEEHLQGL
jgi:DnaD/phage-associated family protein